MTEAVQLLGWHVIRYTYCKRRLGRRKKALLVPRENIFLLVLKSLLIINTIGKSDSNWLCFSQGFVLLFFTCRYLGCPAKKFTVIVDRALKERSKDLPDLIILDQNWCILGGNQKIQGISPCNAFVRKITRIFSELKRQTPRYEKVNV